ncbi:MAG: PaaI family thioesterase [Candidatus Helarchaeota archaeon]
MDPKELKIRAQEDNFFKFIGIEIVEIAQERAKVSLQIREELLNFFNAGHGGAIYSLADSAFQLACNAHENIEIAVALNTALTFIKKVELGEKLVAEAQVIANTRRTSTTDIKIRNEQGELVAVFTGLAYVRRKG